MSNETTTQDVQGFEDVSTPLPSTMVKKDPEVLAPKKDDMAVKAIDAIVFLLERERRHLLVSGRKSRALGVAKMINGLGFKTETEREEEAEQKRIEATKSVSETVADDE